MVDVVSPAKRSEMMSGIRGKDTLPELLVRRTLFAAGYRFRLQRRDLPGSPDIVLPRHRVAIFVHGCFWHMHHNCRFSKIPSTRTEFWRAKLSRNAERDRAATQALKEAGWRVLTVWECATRGSGGAAGLADLLNRWIRSDEQCGEIPTSMPG